MGSADIHEVLNRKPPSTPLNGSDIPLVQHHPSYVLYLATLRVKLGRRKKGFTACVEKEG